LILRLAQNSVVDSSSSAGPPSAVTSASLTIDRTAPTATWIAPAATVTSLPLSYTLTFSENISGLTSDDFINANTTSAKAVGCVITPSASTGTVFTVTVTSCSDGILTLRLKASSVVDGAGNLGTAANSDASTVTLDRAPPVITWLSPTVGGFTTSTSITPNWSVADGVSLATSGTVNLMRATLTGDTCGSFTSQGAQTKNAATVLSTGYCYYWTFAAAPTDTAGNATSGASLTSATLKVDTAGTIVVLTAPMEISTYATDQPLIFTATFSRNITGIDSSDFVNQGTSIGCVITPQANSYVTTDSPLRIFVTNCSEGTLILELSANSVFHSTNVPAPGVPFRASTVIIDRTAPTVIGKSPADGASNVAVNANIVLTFSEAVNSQIGAISIKKFDGTLIEKLSVSDSQVTGLGTDTITINFDRNFTTLTTFYLEIDPGTFVDHAGLPFAGFSGASNLLFTTVPGFAQTITFVTSIDKLTTDAPFDPGAIASSGLPISYTSSNPAVASIVDGLITVLSAGSTVITAIQLGNSAFEAADPVSATLTISTPPAPTPPTPPSSGGGGGGAPAPAAPIVETPEEILTKLWGENEKDGLRIRWEGTSKPVKITIISSLDEKFDLESSQLETGELVKILKPGLAYSISAIPTASKKVDSQQTIAYALPPLAPIDINAKQAGLNLVAMTWEQPSYAEKFRVTIVPSQGEALTFVTTDKNLQIDVAKDKSYKISIVAIGAKNLESTVSVFNWAFKGVLKEGNYSFTPGANNTLIVWTLLENAKAEKYRILVRGKVLCETADTTCTVKGLYGGNSNLTIEAMNSTVIDSLVATYIPSKNFRLVGRIFFDGFSSNIAKTYTKKIKEMAAFVLVSGFSEVQITGHSDQFKNAPLVKNSTLSTKRAAQVVDAMKKLLPKVKFTAVGRGNSSPYKSGKYADPKNRRVQIYTR
jgi:outer membrane protein OmpA-like peptidoglycan-associated protein/methionine-rich copper-binding protein CopC